MWVLLAFSVVVLAVALDRAIAHWTYLSKAQALHDTVRRCLQRGAIDDARSACERSRSPLADVCLVGYERSGRSKHEHVASAVHRERVRVLAELKSRTWLLGTIGATAPFVGLFGTVVGIIEGLTKIFEAGKNDLAIVAGPLSEALYATAAGILVAVEAVIVFNYFNQRLAKVALETKLLTEEFLELLEECGDDIEAKSEQTPGKTPGKKAFHKQGTQGTKKSFASAERDQDRDGDGNGDDEE